MHLRARVGAVVERSGLTQEQFGENAKIDPSTLSKLVRGKRALSLKHLFDISSAARVNIADLVCCIECVPADECVLCVGRTHLHHLGEVQKASAGSA